jgi:hypothetical protein
MPQERPWGVLAYIVADQSDLPPTDARKLDAVALKEVEKMVAAARGCDEMYLSVHLDRTLTRGSLRVTVPGGWENLPEEQSGLAGLQEFVETARSHCPAERYLLLLWGHGGGPLGLFSDPDPGVDRGKGRGELSLKQLPAILDRGRRGFSRDAVDVVVVKSCYAATLEALYEIGTRADYVISSQARVPLRTWTHWEELRLLTAKVSTDAVAFGVLEAIAEHYQDPRERHGRAEIPFTLFRPERAADVASILEQLSKRLLAQGDNPAVARAVERSRPGAAGDKALLDVRTLCRELRSFDDPEVAATASTLDGLLIPGKDGLIVRHSPTGSLFGGVGLFHFPRDPLQRVQSFANDVTRASYQRLDLPNVTGWKDLAFPYGRAAAERVPQRM